MGVLTKGQIKTNQIGVVFQVQVFESNGKPLSDASATCTFRFTKPTSGDRVDKVGALVNAAVDGKFRYVSTSSVLDTAGTWSCDPRVVTTAGFNGAVDSFEFDVVAEAAAP